MTPHESDTRRIALGLAIVQLLDALGNALAPQRVLDDHLDRLGVPTPIRRVLQPIKLASSAALLSSEGRPRLRQLTAACLVGYYAAAVGFHVRAGDPPLYAAPAAALGGAALVLAVRSR